MLAYVYGVVPLSLCRNGGCSVLESSARPDVFSDDDLWTLASSTVDRSSRKTWNIQSSHDHLTIRHLSADVYALTLVTMIL
ncbi:hypothetical protein NECAME_10356 [Necator americanus]|uniref:Uncharacterized protein n=1 Tax=Necator americanus TaxID=51031 RepID=W2T8S9_NECAM|nr:hypothetical protein NECAME_10356 [Necator americanus]ETN78410.1 hypothetical protein NECAME_10356 [Necator americanus]